MIPNSNTSPPEKNKICFFINPVSGGGTGKKVYDSLPEIMFSLGFQPENYEAVLINPQEWEKQILARLDVAERIIAVGGDGTLASILSFLVKSSNQTKVGLIPLGTGNDLARSLGIYPIYHSRGVLGCLKRLIQADPIAFTLWQLNESKTFAAYLSIGSDALIIEQFDRLRKKGFYFNHPLYNKLVYTRLSLRGVKKNLDSKNIRIWDQGKEIPLRYPTFKSILFANINSYSGGSSLTCKLSSPQKYLNLYIIYNYSDVFKMVILPRLLPGFLHKFLKYKHHFQVLSPEIEVAGLPWQLDGESQNGNKLPLKNFIRPLGTVRLLDLRSPPYQIL